MTRNTTAVCISTIFILACTALGQYHVTWHTTDGGGGHSAGGTFRIDGTIGQHDAGPGGGPMTGGVFEVVGGFWSVPATACTCLGDMNGDGFRNGADVQMFVNCLTLGGSCSCADVNSTAGVTIDDLAIFVEELLLTESCS